MKVFKFFLSFILVTVTLTAYSQTTSFKRGISGDLLDLADLKAADSIGWYYNWGQTAMPGIEDVVKDYIDYTPMAWDTSFDSAAMRSYLAVHPEIKYMLGFNEPNFLEQANMTPSEAAALWPELEELADEFNLELVGPAVNFCYSGGAVIENGTEYLDPIEYLDDFFRALPDTSRVDYIAIHAYFDNTGALPWYISLFDKYDKPIWVTEFNHSAGTTTTETSQQNFMVEAVDYFEHEPRIFRYAWFLTRNPYQLNTNIFENNMTGELTDLGLIYANMSSCDSSFWHSIGDTIEAEHYLDMNGIHLITVEDTEGILAAHDFDDGDWMAYNVRIEENKYYYPRIRITSVWESSFSIYDGNQYLGTWSTPITGSPGTWETISYKDGFKLAAGDHEIKILTHYGGWRLNWFKLSELPGTSSAKPDISETGRTVTVFPNPLDRNGILNINTEMRDYEVSIFNLTGRRLFYDAALNDRTSHDLSFLPGGCYILRLKNSDFNYSAKILVR